MLTAQPGLTPDDYARIQGDQASTQARELLPFMLTVSPETPEQAQALEMLRAWDGAISAERCIGIRQRSEPRLKEHWCWNPSDRLPEDKISFCHPLAEAYRELNTAEVPDSTARLGSGHALSVSRLQARSGFGCRGTRPGPANNT